MTPRELTAYKKKNPAEAGFGAEAVTKAEAEIAVASNATLV
jgi:hypothetical protein